MSFPTVRVAAVQAAPVVLDVDATIDKAAGLIEQAAEQGAVLAVLPECFVSIYPTRLWAGGLVESSDAAKQVWRRMWDSAVDVRGAAVERLVGACSRAGIHAVVGINEREDDRPGASLYNTMLVLGPSGVLHRHRKLMPTFQERLFHGFGRGDDLHVVETPAGRVGGLICWENRMPLARYAIYRGGPQVYVAPTADDSAGWRALMSAIAIESGAFVVSVCQVVRRSDYPADFPVPLPDREVFSSGGSCIVGPGGDLVAGPLHGEEGILVADCDLGAGADTKQWFDVVGHYAREDVLLPLLAPPGDASG
jgi:predicted amidohydrolase